MKKILFVLSFMLPFLLNAQTDAATNTMYENLLITPTKGKFQELHDKMAAHNQKYHSEGPYSVNVYQVIGGPNNGKMIWSMGPCNFSHIGSNPGGDEHNADWVNNVIPLTDNIAHNGFWSLDANLSYSPENSNFSKFRIRSIDIKTGERYRFNQMMANIREVYAKKGYNTSHAVFNRRLATSDGRDVGVVFGYNDWSELDGQGVSADFEEIHGQGSWQLFLEELEGCVERVDDELWQRVADLSVSNDN